MYIYISTFFPYPFIYYKKVCKNICTIVAAVKVSTRPHRYLPILFSLTSARFLRETCRRIVKPEFSTRIRVTSCRRDSLISLFFIFVSSYLPFRLEVIQKNGNDKSPSSGPLTPTKRSGKRKKRSRKYVSRNISETIGRFYILSHESALNLDRVEIPKNGMESIY